MIGQQTFQSETNIRFKCGNNVWISIMKIYMYFRSMYYYLLSKKREKYLNGLVKNGLRLGNNVELVGTFFFDPSHCFLISIGDNCTICPNVKLIAHDASTKRILGYTKIGRIDIRENCFLGDSTIVLPNVRIGPNSISGAGSVVTKDIPPNMVAAGNPARIICSVDEYIEKVQNISRKTNIFGSEYFIEELDDEKRNEIIRSVGTGVGFIA